MYSENDYSGSQIGGGYMQNDGTTSPAISKPLRVVNQCLLPCTIKQILLSPEPKPDENLCIDGKELSNISIIGIIVQIDVQSTHVTYRIDDGSGMIDIKIWNADSNNSKQAQFENLKLSSYIRVIGRVQIFKGKKTITGFTLIPILDMNEITLHFLEVVNAHLSNTVANKKLNFDDDNNNNNNKINNYNKINNNNNNNNKINNNNNNNNKSQQPINNNANRSQYDDSIPDGNWSDLEKKIFRFINRPEVKHTEEGASVEQIFSAMNDEDINDIREAIERLSTEGQLYTTIDEEHYKSTC